MTEVFTPPPSKLIEAIISGATRLRGMAERQSSEVIADATGLLDKVKEGVLALEQENGGLSDNLVEAQQQPWPEWVTEILDLTRSYSGADGFDDATQGVDLVEEVREAYSELSGYGERMKVRAENAEAMVAEMRKIASGQRPIAEAPRDGTVIIALLRDDVYPAFSSDETYTRWNGIEVPIFHAGHTASGFDLRWAVAAPLGYAGIPDEWVAVWRPALTKNKFR